MLAALAKSIFGSSNDRYVRSMGKIVDTIAGFEPTIAAMTDQELRAQTDVFRARLADGVKLDDILPEAFATVREAASRSLGQRHYDVQMIGGIALHRGEIAEMRTGEGKTLVATLATYLNALPGGGVHVVTVNDYLAKRDADWMGQVYRFLGLSVGVIVPNLSDEQRRDAYNADITYATNNELGFDYLRDNMKYSREQMVQRPFAYAIVDEVDSILIDEARTPLIISGPAGDAADRYYQFAQIIKQLRKDRDYEVDIKHRNATLTEEGIDRVEQLASIPSGESIYDERYVELTHYLEQALTAHAVYARDKDYIVREGEVIIIDEFTGRMMVGRRYNEGLHQSIEAKENVRVRRQNVTMATITFQNFFRMYDKLAGMTGTAETESEEFYRIYNLPVVTIPTNREMIRDDAGDQIFKTEPGKFAAVVNEIEHMRSVGRPVLVGTTSIEKSEELSQMLERKGVQHSVLNAKQHEREAAIVVEAGKRGAVTIATNMAGRGTDIQLEEGVAEIGGLHIIGTERHESRRIDNQLRGRAGRQGDPGSSRFFVSLEDELMRRFGSERIGGLMNRLGMEEDQPIEHRMISKSIESAQTKVEGHNFDRRKHVVEYDDVMNRHREVIYGDRRKIVAGEDVHEKIQELIAAEVEFLVDTHSDEKEQAIDLGGLLEAYDAIIAGRTIQEAALDGLDREELVDRLIQEADSGLAEVAARFPGDDTMAKVERHVLLMVIDKLWVDHLTAMDDLRQGVGLQAYGQKDPLVVYKTEGYRMYAQLLQNIQHDVVRSIYRAQPAAAQQPLRTRITETEVSTNSAADTSNSAQRKTTKVRPNAPCPCGSGKKYKHCHGAPVARAVS